jgi:hypothetical protein
MSLSKERTSTRASSIVGKDDGVRTSNGGWFSRKECSTWTPSWPSMKEDNEFVGLLLLPFRKLLTSCMKDSSDAKCGSDCDSEGEPDVVGAVDSPSFSSSRSRSKDFKRTWCSPVKPEP